MASTIHSAKLTILTGVNSSVDSVSLHRMLVPWSGTATWSTFGAGVATDGWVWHTSEAGALDQRPQLSVVYSVPEPAGLAFAVAAVMAWWAAARTSRPSANTARTGRDP